MTRSRGDLIKSDPEPERTLRRAQRTLIPREDPPVADPPHENPLYEDQSK